MCTSVDDGCVSSIGTTGAHMVVVVDVRGWYIFCESIKILADQILLVEIVPDSTYDENVPIRSFHKFWTSLVTIQSIAPKALASWI